MSSDIGRQHPQDMANAGAGPPVGGGQNVTFWQAQDPQGVVNAFQAIIGGVKSCSFMMDGHVTPGGASQGAVTLDGRPISFGTEWKVEADGKTLDLLGAACDAVKSGASHAVAAEFSCEIILP